MEILFLEDKLGEIQHVRDTLRDANVRNNLHVVENPSEAAAFLRREGNYRDAPCPDLILLDLNLLETDDGELSAAIKMAGQSQVSDLHDEECESGAQRGG